MNKSKMRCTFAGHSEIHNSNLVEEIKTTTILKNNERLEELQRLFGLQQFKCNEEYISTQKLKESI